MTKRSRRNMNWWMAAAIILLTAAGVAVFHFNETLSWTRYVAYVVVPLLGLILLGLWYAFFTGLPWRKKFGCFGAQVFFFLLLAAAMLVLFRYDDTYGGTSLPKPTWRWAPPADADVAALPEPPAEAPREGEVKGRLENWPQFLGPNRTGEIFDVKLVTDWEQHPPELLWKQEIGPGWASFAVHGRNAITMEQRGDEETTTCYDVISGDLIWSHADKARYTAEMGGIGPRSTPAIEGGAVYTQGATGIVNCLDAKTGELIWSRNVLAEFSLPNVKWGKSNSPLVYGDHVIVTGGGNDEGPLLLAYHRDTGELIWQSENGAASFASPVVKGLDGRNQLLSVNWNHVTGHDPASGETLWKWNWESTFPKVGQPRVIDGSKVLVSAGYGMGSHLIDVSGGQAEKIWSTIKMKPKFSSVVIKDGYAYGLDEGILACLEIETGDRVWKGGRYGFGQIILVSDTILVQAENGSLALVEATPDDYNEIATSPAIEGVTWNVPTLAGSYLLVRNAEEAACFRVKLRE